MNPMLVRMCSSTDEASRLMEPEMLVAVFAKPEDIRLSEPETFDSLAETEDDIRLMEPDTPEDATENEVSSADKFAPIRGAVPARLESMRPMDGMTVPSTRRRTRCP